MSSHVLPPLDQLDPQEVWQPWKPDADQPWDLKWAAHLYRRAAFGAPPYVAGRAAWDQLQQAVRLGVEGTLEQLFHPGPSLAEFDRLMDAVLPANTASDASFGNDAGLRSLQAWWLHRMAYTPFPLRERLTLFWHNHFATSLNKVRQPGLMLQQNQLLRTHALGTFRPFLLAMSRDPAMLIWLDSNSNVKAHPNENYARELMELFTLGVGNYTEVDVREAARAFTGWHLGGSRFDSDRGTVSGFRFNAAAHDDGDKTILGHTGRWDGTDVISLLLEQPAAARFLVRKLYREFLSESSTPPEALLEPLAEQLRRSDYDLAALVDRMLRSRLFFSQHAYRQRIKSPVEYAIGLVRSLDGQASPAALAGALSGLGQDLFAPPNVKGWEGGRTWLNTVTLLGRHNLAAAFLAGTPVASTAAQLSQTAAPPVKLDLNRFTLKYAGDDPARQVELLLNLFLQADVEPSIRSKLDGLLVESKSDVATQTSRLLQTAHTILLLPEYQLA